MRENKRARLIFGPAIQSAVEIGEFVVAEGLMHLPTAGNGIDGSPKHEFAVQEDIESVCTDFDGEK